MLIDPHFPPPTEFGAPARFANWRREQSDAVYRLLQEEARFPGISAPCGIGKSLIPMMIHALTGDRVLVLTPTRALEDQYVRDWETFGAYDVRGQQNYPCAAVAAGGILERYYRGSDVVMCDRGPCHVGVWCKLKTAGCEYYDRRNIAASRNLVVTNPDYWIAIGQSGREQLGTFDWLFIDEADEVDARIRAALHTELWKPHVGEYLCMNLPEAAASVDVWQDFGREALTRTDEVIRELSDEIEEDGAFDSWHVAKMRKLKDLKAALGRVAALDASWLVAEGRGKPRVDFDPVWPAAYAEAMLYRGTPHVVMMSATLTRKDMRILGVPDAEMQWIEYASPFPVADRPVYILDAPEQMRIRVDSRMKPHALQWLVATMDAAIGKRLDRKQLIHSVSYHLMNDILRLSKHAKLMRTHDDADEKPQALRDFRRAKPGEPGSILLSPGVKVGESFEGAECETVHWPKIPFLDMRDPIMRRREAEDPEYGGHLMMKSLVQGCGRHVRFRGDRGESILYDDHARWAVPKYGKRGGAPRSFMESVKWVTTIPEPLRKL